MIKILFANLLLFLSCFVHASDTVMTLPLNQKQFQVKLAANPTTGFQWALVNYDKSLLKLISNQYRGSVTKFMGAGGVMEFNFGLIKNLRAGANTKIQFRYARPWESRRGTLKTVTIIFR